MTRDSKKKARQAALKYGYRSGLEEKIAQQIMEQCGEVNFETFFITYQRPTSKYTPDFLLPNGIVIETKGRFVAADRSKHLLVKKQNPQYDIRFVFSNPNAKISKTSSTTYAKWCERNGFKYAAKLIPEEWFNEEK